jgi:release factor glutamine methyltransferase
MENQTTEAIETPARRVSAILRQAARRLVSSGIESGALDAEVLLGHVLDVRREQLIIAANGSLRETELRAYERLLSRRLEREPTAYITGKREFWSLDFHVTRDVLIPRTETELLVEIALGLATELSSSGPLHILDIGTGSGAIAIALATELASVKIVATDLSAAALAVAQGNAARNRVAGKIKFMQGDLFETLAISEQFDLIISNPPYIRSIEIDELEPEVRDWEPRGALDGGLDGLNYYRRIAARAFHYLAPAGVLAVEIGTGMGEAVAALFKNSAGSAEVNIRRDYAAKERVVVARRIATTMNSL